MSKFGGGGNICTICDKTAYPAETISFDKKPYHVECFRCDECHKKMEGAGKAAQFEDTLYCHLCFKKNGFAQKQKKVVWTKKESTGTESAGSSKFGGGGTSCTACGKTVYAAETLSFDKKPYHSECFKCSSCDKKMTPSGAASFEGQNFCTKCFKDGGYSNKQAKTASGGSAATTNAMASKFGGGGTPCTACAKTVYAAETLSFDKKPYHSECFKCSTCGKKMTPSGAASFEGEIHCTKCFKAGGYTQKQAATARAHVAVTSTPNAMASKFGGGGTKCTTCGKTVYAAETLSFEKQPYHSDCFKCTNCDKKMTPSGAEGKNKDGFVTVYCKKCWGELGLNRATVS